MIKLLIGALLMATTTLAQTTLQSVKKSSTKPTSSSQASTVKSTKPTSGSTAKPVSTRPIPPPSQKDNLESGDNAIPSYKKEKDAGVHKGVNRYTPRKNAAGARKDTLIDRRKP